MNSKTQAAKSLIFYPGKNYVGSQNTVLHGDTGQIATNTASWIYQSVAMSEMQSFVFSTVNATDPSMSYLGHVEDIVAELVSDLPARYPSSDQFPLNYLGLDPARATVVLLDIDASQAEPDAVAATSQVGDSETIMTTLSLPGRPGAVAFVELTEGSSVTASCPYGDYNTSDGKIAWRGNGSIELAFSGGEVILVNSSDFPAGWSFTPPEAQIDGSWMIALNGGVPASNTITSVTATPTQIVNDGVSASAIVATVIDGDNLPAAGVTVSWNTTAGSLTPLTSVTGSNGQATTTLTDAGTPGIATVTGTIDSGSKSVQVTVTDAVPDFIIKGQRSQYRASGQFVLGRLVAFDASTLQPVSAEWRLSNGSVVGTGSTLLDPSPEDALTVSVSGKGTLTINPANIVGNGEWTDTSTSAGAFAARLDNGTALGWGVSADGGTTPSSSQNYGVATFASTFYAFTALRADGSLFCWGNTAEGGAVPQNIAALTGVQEVRGTRGTFALRSPTYPYIQTWGWGVDGTEDIDMNVPSNIAAMANIQKLIANDNAFAVVNTAGQVYAWGEAASGAAISSTVSTLSGISECCASRRAFAVICAGKLYSWGDEDYGGKDGAVSGINNAVRLVATESAFTALLSTGGTVCWGNETYGNSMPPAYQSRSDIVDVKATYGAFATLCSDGTVLAWGNSQYGGNCSSVASQLYNIVALSATSGSFAALTREGNVIVWGNTSTGGNSTAVTGELYDICAVYANTHAFAALRKDDEVVVWGDSISGASNVPVNLSGNISYLIK